MDRGSNGDTAHCHPQSLTTWSMAKGALIFCHLGIFFYFITQGLEFLNLKDKTIFKSKNIFNIHSPNFFLPSQTTPC